MTRSGRTGMCFRALTFFSWHGKAMAFYVYWLVSGGPGSTRVPTSARPSTRRAACASTTATSGAARGARARATTGGRTA